jgi:hypothetical protein
MGILFPFLEILKMTKAALPVANIIRFFLGKDRIRAELKRKARLKKKNKENKDTERVGHFAHVRSSTVL